MNAFQGRVVRTRQATQGRETTPIRKPVDETAGLERMRSFVRHQIRTEGERQPTEPTDSLKLPEKPPASQPGACTARHDRSIGCGQFSLAAYGKRAFLLRFFGGTKNRITPKTALCA